MIGKHPIAEYRDARRLSQAKAAAEFGRAGIRVSQQQIDQWEKWVGLPRKATLIALAEFLGVTIDRFYGPPATPARRSRKRVAA